MLRGQPHSFHKYLSSTTYALGASLGARVSIGWCNMLENINDSVRSPQRVAIVLKKLKQVWDEEELLWVEWSSREELSEEVTLQLRPKWGEGWSPMQLWGILSWDFKSCMTQLVSYLTTWRGPCHNVPAAGCKYKETPCWAAVSVCNGSPGPRAGGLSCPGTWLGSEGGEQPQNRGRVLRMTLPLWASEKGHGLNQIL